MIEFTLVSRRPLLNSALAALSGYLLDVVLCPNSHPFGVFHLPNKLLSLDSSASASKHLMLFFVPSLFWVLCTLAGHNIYVSFAGRSCPGPSPGAISLTWGSQRGVNRKLRKKPHQAMEHLTI